MLSLVVSLNSALAFSGATVPWITYEAENMTNTGTILGPSYAGNNVTSESSGRQCVHLSTNGAYMQFTAQTTSTAIVVRYSVPDTANGVGTNYTLSLYTNGIFAAKLPMTSMYSWLYGSYPFNNNPGSGPRNFYDEVRTNGWMINPGDVIKLQKDATDTASFYDIDLVDLENVPPPITNQPNGSVSVKIYGAVGDGVSDDTSAIQGCISGNASTWLPPGNYKVTGLINIPPNKTVQGAGIWYTTLVGDPTLYSSSSRRVTLNGGVSNGNGGNIHLSDIAIVGKLNYRNDSEPNDGIGGSFGTGSTISNMWVEHTKTGAWIVNSQGLVVSNCRFRDTIADGINLVVGMRSCTVTNCTARGTGDDCFPIWPATYTSQAYTPGFNVITHCTGQTPFLANGGAIYGGVGNTIQDCLFQDIPYDCGILIATTFPVGANTFSGTTVVQRCDLIRCGGAGVGAGLQICLNASANGLSGLNLNNLNITNSASDGLSIIGGTGNGPTGTLANAIMSNVNIPNYGLGGGGRNGLWARNDAVGSMTVSNSTIVEYRNDSPNFTFNFVSNTIPVAVQTSPTGLSFTVDGTPYTTTQVFNWIPNSSHTIATSSPQSGGTGTQYVWSSWSDSGAISHTITPSTGGTYTANFTTQYFLTMNAGTGGSVSPASGWDNSGANVNISATASNGFSFSGWSGTGTGSYSGTNDPASITMNGPITETANFNIPVTVQANPPGDSFTVDGTPYTTTQTFSWIPGSNHTIGTMSPQNAGGGAQDVWTSWSDGGAISHLVAPTTVTTYTATFTTQYYLTMTAGIGGSVTPSSGWNNSGAVVGMSAIASNGYGFTSWSGSGSGLYSGTNNPASVTMNGPITETASFVQIPTRVISVSGNLAFGGVGVGSSSNLTFTVSNAGNSTLTVSNIAYPDGFTGDWSGTLASGGSTNLTVTFSPVVATSYGGNLTVNSDATSGVSTLAVSGIGMLTNGAPVAPTIMGITVNPDFTVTLSYTTMTGFAYHVEATPNLVPASWSILPDSVTNATGASVTFTDTNAPGNAQLFYRVGSP